MSRSALGTSGGRVWQQGTMLRAPQMLSRDTLRADPEDSRPPDQLSGGQNGTDLGSSGPFEIIRRERTKMAGIFEHEVHLSVSIFISDPKSEGVNILAIITKFD